MIVSEARRERIRAAAIRLLPDATEEEIEVTVERAVGFLERMQTFREEISDNS